MFRFVARFAPTVTRQWRQPCVQAQKKIMPLAATTVRKMSTEVVLSDEERDANWIAYFDNAEIDYFDFCLGFHDLWQEDAVPEPAVMQSALYACRRLNNLPIALRCLELLRVKCVDKKEIYDYVIQELGPTLQDLGLKTPEQLGLDQVSD